MLVYFYEWVNIYLGSFLAQNQNMLHKDHWGFLHHVKMTLNAFQQQTERSYLKKIIKYYGQTNKCFCVTVLQEAEIKIMSMQNFLSALCKIQNVLDLILG